MVNEVLVVNEGNETVTDTVIWFAGWGWRVAVLAAQDLLLYLTVVDHPFPERM